MTILYRICSWWPLWPTVYSYSNHFWPHSIREKNYTQKKKQPSGKRKKERKDAQFCFILDFCKGLKITMYAFCSGTVRGCISGNDNKSLDQNGASSIPACGFFIMLCRTQNFKLLRSPVIDSKEWIPPAYVTWRAGTTTLFQLGS